MPGAGGGELPRCWRPARGRRPAQVKGRARRGGRRPLGAEPAAAESPEPPHGALGSRRPGADGLCGCACECASECECARALAVWAVGGRARLRAGLQEARLPRSPRPVARAPGGKLPQPSGPPALASPGQVSAPRGPRFVQRPRPGPAQVTRRWPRVTWVWVGARGGLQGRGGLAGTPKPGPGGRGRRGSRAPLASHQLLRSLSRAADFKLSFCPAA